MTKVRTRFWGILLVVVLLLSLLPATALAADTGVTCSNGDNCTTHEAAVTTAGGTTLHYATIADAIHAANSTSGSDTITVKLLQDKVFLQSEDNATTGKEDTYSTFISKDMILDLNGKTLTCKASYAGISVRPDVHFTIKNGTFENISTDTWACAIEASKSANVGGTGCTITLEEQVTVKAKYSAVYGVGYTTIEVFNSAAEGEYAIYGAGPTNNVTLRDAEVTGSKYGVYQGPYDPKYFLNENVAGSEYKIYNSEITGDSAGVCINNYVTNVATGNHTLLVENSEITGGTGIETKRTDVTIKGDDTVITATGTAEAMNPDGSPVSSGYAVAAAYYNSEAGAIGTLKIEGGTFKGAVGIQEPAATGTTPAPPATLNITGGTFLKVGGQPYDVSQYISDGMTQDENDGKVIIDKETAVASVGDVGYTSLADAVAAARSGETITLLKEISDQTLIELGTDKDVTIDLNGFNIGFAESSYFKVKGGKLHLTGRGKVYEQKPYNAPIKIWGSTNDVADYSVVTVDENVTLEGWAGIFITVNPDGSGVNHAFGVKVTVDGSINSVEDTSGDDGHGVYINGMNQDMSSNVPQITLGPTSKITSTGNGIYAAGYAQWNLAGDITAPDALSIKSGTFNITGGTYHSTGAFADPAAANSNGSENTGAALSITSNDDYATKTVVNVTGGTFISDNSYAVYEGIAKKENTPAADSSYATISISGGTFQGNTDKGDVKIAEASNKKVVSGGTFSTDLSTEEYEGYLADDVKYQVAHQAGGFSYTKTLTDAQALAQQGDSITDLKAITEGTVTLTLDYNDGDATTDATYTVTSGTAVSLPTPTRANYTFDGWYKADGTKVTSSYTVTETITLTAQWTYNGPSSSGSSTTYYGTTVEKSANGTVTVSPKNASKNTTVTITVTPDDGYELASLTVTDKDGKAVELTKVSDTKYTFKMPASKVTVKAAFAEEEIVSTLPFSDVGVDDWFYEAVQYVYENGMMNGVGNNLFAPSSNLTRGMIAQVLYNLEGTPAAGNGVFTDVAANQWYADAVNWAAANDIVGGYGNGKFGPEDDITREQMAQILYNYATFKGYDVNDQGDLSTFNDGAKTSDWALSAMKWAVGSGLLQGYNGNLNPTGTATRAEVAQILMNFCENIAK